MRYNVFDRTSGYEFRSIEIANPPQAGDTLLISNDYTKGDELFRVTGTVHLCRATETASSLIYVEKIPDDQKDAEKDNRLFRMLNLMLDEQGIERLLHLRHHAATECTLEAAMSILLNQGGDKDAVLKAYKERRGWYQDILHEQLKEDVKKIAQWDEEAKAKKESKTEK